MKENKYGRTILFGCEDCRHWKSYIDTQDGIRECSTCKRADGVLVKFAPIAGTKYPPGAHLICSDFTPKSQYKLEYDGFNNYFSRYRKYWNMDKDPLVSYVPYIIYGDNLSIYYVNTLDFIYDNLWDYENKFNAVVQFYHKPNRRGVITPVWKDLDGPVDISLIGMLR